MKNRHESNIPKAEQLCDKADLFVQSEKFNKALVLFNKILDQFEHYPRALNSKGGLLFRLGKVETAIEVIRECLDTNPHYSDAWHNLGNIYRSCYRYEDALACYKKILLYDKGDFRACFLMGQIRQKELDDTGALEYFNRALDINKKFVPAYLGMYHIYRKRNNLVEAEKVCRTVHELDPQNEEAAYLFAAVRAEHGDMHDAIRLMEKVKFTDSYGMAAHASIIYYLNLLPENCQEQIYNESRLFEERFASRFYPLQKPHVNCPLPERKLRIGFVSGDLKLHPVARHLIPLITNLDRNHFELYAYSNYNIHDSMTEFLKSRFCYWRNIHETSDEKVVEMIRLDTIDILFDLSGYTGHSRLMLFAHKPAPIQISWIGYFNTTGFRTMDYVISDEVTIPRGEEEWFTEEILRMPYSRFCYDPREDLLPAVAPLPKIKNRHVTFGAFCKVNKLNEHVVETWSRILVAVPESKLVLKWFAYKDITAVKSVSDRFVKYGIDPLRLEFRGESGYVDLLREYTTDIDISLDTFPHSGGATSCDALCMGVPVVTLSGQIPISRQTHGFLKLMGLEDTLVAFSEDEYIDRAVQLSRNTLKLKELRTTLRERFFKSPLCDGVTFSRDFDMLMRSVWHRWCSGKSQNGVLALENPKPSEVYNEGINLMGMHFYKAASLYFSKALEYEPRNDKALNNLAICLWEDGDLQGAEQVLLKARKINRNNDDVCCNLSGLLVSKNKRAALTYSRKGLKINNNNIDLYTNHIVALLELSRMTEAIEAMDVVLSRFPVDSRMLAQKAYCHGSMGDADRANEFLRKALELDSTNANAHSNLLYSLNNSDKYTQQEMFQEALRWDQLHAVVNVRPPCLSRPRAGHAKLRIGLVSADFRQHPGGMLLYPFIEHYDRDRLEVFCYFNHHKYDEMTNLIKSKCDAWREVMPLSDQELFDLVQNDQIDILIDMNGHTDKHRLKLFTMKPCRIQASWLGFFNTTGVSAIDYFISDDFTTPDWMQKWFSEKIVRLPHSRFCYAAPQYSPLVSLSPAEWKGYITFGSFNNCVKISDTTLGMWARILTAVPKSRLMLKWKSYRDKSVKDWFLQRFERFGIVRSRIIFHRDIDHAQMLADYSDVDISLDTYPFNGGMTSIESLWMGVPIITLSGESPASRQTGSFLRLLDLEECIATDQDGYVSAAIQLVKNRERLYDIRGTLRQRMKNSPLMNGELFARDMLQVLEQMYQEKQ